MKYSSASALKLAQQIRDRFGLKIAEATEGTPVPPKFVAGLIAVEAGKKNGQILETATRFEPGVFAKLQQVRDGQRKSWSGIKTAHIRDAVDLALRALATSYGLTQVMGWHTINNLDCTVAELRDPEKHLGYAVKLLLLNSADGDFERKQYVGEFREWNSGREQGATHDPDYVYNASAVMEGYTELEPVQTKASPDKVAPSGAVTNPAAKAGEPVPEVAATTGEAIVGGRPDDKPKQVTQGGLISRVVTAVGSATGIGTAIVGFVQGNAGVVMVGIICLTILILAFMFRQALLDYLRLQLGAAPDKYNVR